MCLLTESIQAMKKKQNRGKFKKTKPRITSGQRDIFKTPKKPTISKPAGLLNRIKKPVVKLNDIEDNRSRWTTPKNIDGTSAIIKTAKKTVNRFNAKNWFDKTEFKRPEKVIVCVRRKKRREVLFATKNTRKGSGAKRRRLNENSKISCRRK